MSRIVQYLEEIIRAHVRQQLEAAIAKQPVLGGEGVAYETAPVPTVDEILTWLMDSGIIEITNPPQALPVTVTIDTVVAAQASTGSTHPNGVDVVYLIDRLLENVTENELEPDLLPWVSSPSYTSEVYSLQPGETELTSAQEAALAQDTFSYTGLLRLAAQAKAGIGGQISEITMDQPAEVCGLIRSSDYVYYLIIIGSSGCTAVQMETQHPLILAYLNTGPTLTDAERSVWEAWLMSSLRVAYERDINGDLILDVHGDPIFIDQREILNAGDMANTYSGRAPIAHGWHFNYDGDSPECSIVTWGQNALVTGFYYTGTLTTVAFDTTGFPAATVSVLVQDSQFGMPWAYDQLWYPISATESQMKIPPTSLHTYAEVGANAPIYCFYRTDGTLTVVKYDYPTENPADPDPGYSDIDSLACGETSGTAEESWNATVSHEGGFKVDGYWLSSILTTRHEVRSSLLSRAAAGTTSRSGWGRTATLFTAATQGTRCPTWSGVVGDVTPNTFCPNDGTRWAEADIEYGTGMTHQTRSETQVRANGKRMCIISGTDPDSIYLAEGYAGYRSYSNSDYNDTDLYILSHDVPGVGVQEVPCERFGGYPGLINYLQDISLSCPEQEASPEVACYENSSENGTVVYDRDTEVPIDSFRGAFLTAAGGPVDLTGDWADWGMFWGADYADPTVGHIMPALSSYNGAVRYFTRPQEAVWLDGAYAGVTSNFRFLGFV